MRYLIGLAMLAVFMLGTAAMAEDQAYFCTTKEVKVKIAKFVKIEFCDNQAFCLDIEVKDGQTFDCKTKSFKAIHNCPARITSSLELPGLPAGVSKIVKLDGDGPVLNVGGTGMDMHSVSVCVGDVDVTDMAGCYHGVLRLCIECTGCGSPCGGCF